MVVVGDPRLATALSGRGGAVILAGAATGAFKRARTVLRMVANPMAIPLRPASVAAMVGVGRPEDWNGWLGEWARACVDGGVVATICRGQPQELSRQVLLAGLSAITQRRVGWTVITAGVVKRFAIAD